MPRVHLSVGKLVNALPFAVRTPAQDAIAKRLTHKAMRAAQTNQQSRTTTQTQPHFKSAELRTSSGNKQQKRESGAANINNNKNTFSCKLTTAKRMQKSRRNAATAERLNKQNKNGGRESEMKESPHTEKISLRFKDH